MTSSKFKNWYRSTKLNQTSSACMRTKNDVIPVYLQGALIEYKKCHKHVLYSNKTHLVLEIVAGRILMLYFNPYLSKSTFSRGHYRTTFDCHGTNNVLCNRLFYRQP